MHEVSLRSASNRMDAHNLAVVLCPNLVSGSNPIRDVIMCSVPGGPTLYPGQQAPSSSFTSSSNPNSPSSPSNKAAPETTLGAIIKHCIQRYYEVFDEVVDRSEPVTGYSLGYSRSNGSTPEQRRSRDVSANPGDDERRARNDGYLGRSNSNLALSSPSRPNYHQRQSSGTNTNPDDDEDIDDAMLVMPLGLEHGHGTNDSMSQQGRAGPPSAWSASGAGAGNGSTPKTHHRTTLSNGSSTHNTGVRSVNTDYGPPSSFSLSQTPSYATYSKAKSTISVEKTGTIGPGRKGSISVGRGTNRKSTGSSVAAVGITAEGFFAPPPVPPLPGNFNAAKKGDEGQN